MSDQFPPVVVFTGPDQPDGRCRLVSDGSLECRPSGSPIWSDTSWARTAREGMVDAILAELLSRGR